MYAVFDIDGCISDDRWRRDRLPTDGLDVQASYQHYHDGCADDPPANKDVFDWQRAHGRQIIYATSRPALYEEETKEWLVKHGFWSPEDILLMRPRNNYDTSPVLKPYLITNHLHFLSQGVDDVAVCHDDRDDVLQGYYDNGFKVAMRLAVDGQELEEVPPEMPQPVPFTAADVLEEMAETFRSRNAQYKANYHQVAPIINLLFPEGVSPQLVAQPYWHLFELLIVKLTRFANQDLQHVDSIHDIAIYAAMIEADLRSGS